MSVYLVVWLCVCLVWNCADFWARPQWSYKKGLAAGVLPAKAYQRSFDCDLSKIPSFSDLPETY